MAQTPANLFAVSVAQVARPVAWVAGLILALCALAQEASAQAAKAPPAVQISTGERSPNVYAPGGSVTVNLVDIRNVIRRFDQLDPGGASRISKLLKAGRYDEARALIAAFADKSASAMATLAFLKYSQGLLAGASGRPVTAEQEFAAAVALAPSSCEYRGRHLQALSVLDRRMEMARLASSDLPEVQACLARGEPAERARFLGARLVLATEAGDQPVSAALAVQLAQAVRSSLVRPSEMSWATVVLTCEVAELAGSVWRDPAQPDRQLLQRLCGETATAAARGVASAAKIFDFGRDFDSGQKQVADKGVSRLTEQITLVERSAAIGELGFGEPERRLAIARLKAERGFSRRWAPDLDLKLVAADYRTAFEGLLPFANPRYPAALSSFAFLTSHIAHFDEMHPDLALKLPVARELERAIDSATEGGYEPWTGACTALAHLWFQASSVGPRPTTEHLSRLKTELGRCAAAGFGSNSLASREFQRIVLQGDLQAAQAAQRYEDLRSLSDRLLESYEADRGFPAYALPSTRAVMAAHSRAYALSVLGLFKEARVAWQRMADYAREAESKYMLQTALEARYNLLASEFAQEKTAVVDAAMELLGETKLVFGESPVQCTDLMDAFRHSGYAVGSLLAANSSSRALTVAQRTTAMGPLVLGCVPSSTARYTPEQLQSARAVIATRWVDIQKTARLVKPSTDGATFGVDVPQLIKERDELLQGGMRFPNPEMPLITELMRATATLPNLSSR